MPKKKELTPKDKEKIEKLYIEGYKPREIFEKYFKDYNTTPVRISRYIYKKKIGEKKSKIDKKIDENIENKIVADKTNRVTTFNEKHIENFNKLDSALETLLKDFIQESEDIRAGLKKKRVLCTPKNAQVLAEALLDIQKGHRIALGMDNKNSSSEDTEPKITVINGLDITKI